MVGHRLEFARSRVDEGHEEVLDGAQLAHDDLEVREAAAFALGDVDDPAALQALLLASQSGATDVASASIEALASFPHSPEAAATLAEIAITAETPRLRAKALGSLGDFASQGSRTAAEVLALAAEADADPANQRLARRVLADLAEPAGDVDS